MFTQTFILIRWFVLSALLVFGAYLQAGQYITPKEHPVIQKTLKQYLTHYSADEVVKIWVYFTDKGFQTQQGFSKALAQARESISARAQERRQQRGNITRWMLYDDIPVHTEYIEKILRQPGVQIHRATSRWFNGISVEVEAGAVSNLSNYPFVRSVELMRTRTRRVLEMSNVPERGFRKPSTIPSVREYGLSEGQLEQINVPTAHATGYSGEGVIVLMIDTGYNTDHQVFRGNRILAEHDFIQDDDTTKNQPGDHPAQHNHGTATASILGAAVDSLLYGPAYKCKFLLAKTEIYDQEIQVEEDYYVEALEWGERLGADVASSSLGYYDWYEFSDMDGNTAVTTRAVEKAIRLGVTVVTAAGNANDNSWGHIIAPADADSVITVGAVDSKGMVAGFSSRGPTYDGRIKPEVVAQGVGTIFAKGTNDSTYSSSSGTSLSTPLVAGVAALLLEGHPNWSPVQVRDALMMTAGNFDMPNNDIGWGLVNAVEALCYGMKMDSGAVVSHAYPNPFNGYAFVEYTIPEDVEFNEVSFEVFNLRGQHMEIQQNRCNQCFFLWKPEANVPSGMYFYKITAGGVTKTGKFTYVR
ncbi:MAG: S8 family peptidase [Candidatus Marinimicrobia bacterium]|nr:S8 family peptidase [Candidatus Neomarinimicrobiota bacterium]MCF7828356.1 S8 family peptidase [Candidatus Neomarinimicrobiota bacterium]MCF7881051.1 S8 family peptidase [Candidatus Neomarinimicrobiota bacterium]